jgi:CRP-like cAMP-binding protein
MSLASVGVFKGMGQDDLRRLEQGCVVLEPHDGTTLFAQGDPSDAVYAVIGGDGHVRIGAIDSGARTAAAVIEGRVKLVKVSRIAFLHALRTCPSLGEALCRMMALRLRRTFALFQDATFESLEVRLARQILYLAEREGRPTDQGIRLAHRFRQADLADLLGATTRSIITILNAWRTAGVVAYDTDRARLTVRDIAALRAITEADRPG